MVGVYPRVCGGTPALPSWKEGCAGLSPRVRGNLARHFARTRRPGSIPACAGEPSVIMPNSGTSKVYPRVCGGTGGIRAGERTALGLSPRVRGNRPLTPSHDSL